MIIAAILVGGFPLSSLQLRKRTAERASQFHFPTSRLLWSWYAFLSIFDSLQAASFAYIVSVYVQHLNNLAARNNVILLCSALYVFSAMFPYRYRFRQKGVLMPTLGILCVIEPVTAGVSIALFVFFLHYGVFKATIASLVAVLVLNSVELLFFHKNDQFALMTVVFLLAVLSSLRIARDEAITEEYDDSTFRKSP